MKIRQLFPKLSRGTLSISCRVCGKMCDATEVYTDLDAEPFPACYCVSCVKSSGNTPDIPSEPPTPRADPPRDDGR